MHYSHIYRYSSLAVKLYLGGTFLLVTPFQAEVLQNVEVEYTLSHCLGVCTAPTKIDRSDGASIFATLFQVLQNVEVEFAIPQSQRLYCPHKECSAVLMKAEPACPGVPAQCPQCKRCFCADCLFPASHQVRVLTAVLSLLLLRKLPYCLHQFTHSVPSPKSTPCLHSHPNNCD